MKKLLGVLGLLAGALVLSHAGTPQETYWPGQAPLSNTTVNGSTWTASSPVATITPPTCNSGTNSYVGRVCLTKEVVQLSTATVFYALDGGTTVQYLQGIGLAGSTTATGENTLSLPEDHLGPLCFTAGNTVTLSASGTPVAGINNVINYEGYSSCGGYANKGANY